MIRCSKLQNLHHFSVAKFIFCPLVFCNKKDIFIEKEAEIMKKYLISPNFYYTKTRDRIGGTVRTDVFRTKDNFYQAYSYYHQDEDQIITGYFESFDEVEAIKRSRKDLRKVWLEYQTELATEMA